MKRAILLTLMLFLLLTLPGLPVARAANGIQVMGSSVEVDFPMSMTFRLSAAGGASISDLRLHYAVERMSHARVVSEVLPEFTPGPTVDVVWNWDMRKTGGMPPGSSVSYWWTLEDDAGGTLETEAARVQLDDDRYAWRSLNEGLVTLHWYEGDEAFAGALMAQAQQVLERLEADTGAALESEAAIYIYASPDDLLGAMIFPQEWTGGVAYTRFSTIAIGILPDNLDWGRRAMAHELAHLVVHQMVFNPYNDLPTWLDEGLAMYAEGPMEPVFATLLMRAVDDDLLISVRSLASPFSAFAETAVLSYAQSYSLVDFLVSNYGQSRMLELLETFREGSGYDQALQKVYGFDMAGLDELWRSYIQR